ncbi:MAG: leucyl aminopeptidase [Limimaricola sp.]|uniref:leucyl aminopeptidase n=1 Tax=Limimaricola sp. TaxID=2211665 RepID=UPI001D46A280|nr:leucyl aminopeptidase [Limimaricola sp.]MBI1418287.1 leucyl aminopeptidase [Limimaricola sp.]
MTQPVPIGFATFDAAALAALPGRLAVFVTPEGGFDAAGRRLNTATKQALRRLVDSPRFARAKVGDVLELAFPVGLSAEALSVIKLPRRPSVAEARKAGAALARTLGPEGVQVLAPALRRPEEVALGLALRAYDFRDHRSAAEDDAAEPRAVTLHLTDPAAAEVAFAPLAALAQGVFFTRDLVNAPANVLTTESFAACLQDLSALGVEVTVLDETDLAAKSMRLLLSVGQGSASPSKVVMMRWNGGEQAAPLALIGKGVVFDTGGISLKPAGGMEDMTMDMGGAGTVAGVMKALALRKARANVVGLVGLVENMPSGTATRPGDVVTSMKGDTVEIINTDAEGRLVLADLLWFAQQELHPAGMIDLATLTGAIIVALGHENAGLFSNDDTLAGGLLQAAQTEGEGLWRMPMGPGYDARLKSRIADMMNVGGREGGSVTAAQFLRRFVDDAVPWAHLDIAGTASLKTESSLAPKGATGWGVLTLNRLIASRYEAKD